MNKYFIVQALLLSVFSGFATIVGAWLGFCFSSKKRLFVFGLSFAATIMLLISFLDLIPISIMQIGKILTGFFIFSGAILITILNLYFSKKFPAHDQNKFCPADLKGVFYLVIASLIMHDFPEGFTIINSFFYSTSLGIAVAVALFAHNLPEGYILGATAQMCGSKHVFAQAMYSFSATVFGTIFGLLLLQISQELNPILTAFAAGAMIFVAIEKLFPIAWGQKSKLQVFLGMLFALLVYWALTFI